MNERENKISTLEKLLLFCLGISGAISFIYIFYRTKSFRRAKEYLPKPYRDAVEEMYEKGALKLKKLFSE